MGIEGERRLGSAFEKNANQLHNQPGVWAFSRRAIPPGRRNQAPFIATLADRTIGE